MLTPHQVAARLAFGPIPLGATLLQRLRGPAVLQHRTRPTRGSRPRGRICAKPPPAAARSARGPGGSTCAARQARPARSRPRCTTPSTPPPTRFAQILAAVLSEGDPWRDRLPAVRRPRPRVAAGSRPGPVPAECGDDPGTPPGRLAAAVRHVVKGGGWQPTLPSDGDLKGASGEQRNSIRWEICGAPDHRCAGTKGDAETVVSEHTRPTTSMAAGPQGRRTAPTSDSPTTARSGSHRRR